jgi:hypothetical protein
MIRPSFITTIVSAFLIVGKRCAITNWAPFRQM